MRSVLFSAAAAAIVMSFCAMPSVAGETTGNGKDKPVNGKSLCAYSGQNDTPNGDWIEIAPGVIIQIDPGGRTQSYGSFKSLFDWFPSPSDPAAREAFQFPGTGCNPNKAQESR